MNERKVLIEKLKDLHKQATTENSHYYTASLLEETIIYLCQLEPLVSQPSEPSFGQWKYSKKELPKYYEPVLTYDPEEIDHKELFCVDYIYLDPNKKPHWDMHGDKFVYWMELPEEPKNPSRFSG